MMRARFERPEANEYAPYYGRYIELVPEGDLFTILREQIPQVESLLGSLSREQAEHAYAPGKWTVKEVVGHWIDTEWVFAYRAMHLARLDASPLPSFDQDHWAAASEHNGRTLESLVAEWSALRRALIAGLEGLPADASRRSGFAAGNPFTVRALAHIPPGHVIYHLQLLDELYGIRGVGVSRTAPAEATSLE